MPVYTTLGGIQMPPDLRWTDEYDHAPVKVKRDITLAGVQILQVATQIAGRPITLASGDRSAWLTRAKLDLLVAKRDQDYLQIMQLVLPDTRAFSVVFDLTQSPVIAAVAVRPGKFVSPDDYFKVTIKLLTV